MYYNTNLVEQKINGWWIYMKYSSVSTYIIFIITGGNWPSTLALWLVDGLTLKSCIGAVGSCEKSAPLEEVWGFWSFLSIKHKWHTPGILFLVYGLVGLLRKI